MANQPIKQSQTASAEEKQLQLQQEQKRIDEEIARLEFTTLVPFTQAGVGLDENDWDKYPDRHYIRVNWTGDYERASAERMVLRRLREGYSVCTEHPMSNRHNFMLYCSKEAFKKRMDKLTEAGNRRAETNLDVRVNSVPMSAEDQAIIQSANRRVQSDFS